MSGTNTRSGSKISANNKLRALFIIALLFLFGAAGIVMALSGAFI